MTSKVVCSQLVYNLLDHQILTDTMDKNQKDAQKWTFLLSLTLFLQTNQSCDKLTLEVFVRGLRLFIWSGFRWRCRTKQLCGRVMFQVPVRWGDLTQEVQSELQIIVFEGSVDASTLRFSFWRTLQLWEVISCTLLLPRSPGRRLLVSKVETGECLHVGSHVVLLSGSSVSVGSFVTRRPFMKRQQSPWMRESLWSAVQLDFLQLLIRHGVHQTHSHYFRLTPPGGVEGGVLSHRCWWC